HWARTGQLDISLGDNVDSTWQPYFQAAADEWTGAKNIDFVVTPGATSSSGCGGVYGTVQVCSGDYGATGWLGYATVWTGGGFVVMGTVKLNDYYFKDGSRYDTDAWRAMTACQEIGHTLGLAHTDMTLNDPNSGSCMDYTNDPSGTLGTNGTLSELTPNKTDYNALNGIYKYKDATQLPYTTPAYWAGEALSADGEEHDGGGAVVPEPAAWALMIVGFGLTGTTMRRRQQAGLGRMMVAA
ncbi:MAG: PEPxxWA-CTERM sorting domain-containing protein, partial [Janthinobacterium lividum]